MKVVHIITSLKIGGAESLLVDFLAHPSSAQADHVVIFFHDGPNRKRLEELGIPCYALRGGICFYDPLFFIRLYTLVKRLQPACIHSWLWSANIASRLIGKFLKIPLLNSFHLGVDQDGFIRNTLDRLTHSMPERLVAVSQGVADSLTTQFHLYKPAERLKVIKNGIDALAIGVKSQKNKADRQALGLQADHFVIGSVGRWIARKNYSLLIDVFAHLAKRHEKMRLLLLGKGEQKELLQQRALQRGVQEKVIFVEGQPALGYYPLMDCFVQTSLKEGISIALLEAMSCSLPCILTEPSGVHEVILHGKNGILTWPTESLAFDIEQIFYDKNLAITLGSNALKTMRDDFGLTAMVDAYHAEYAQLVRGKRI